MAPRITGTTRLLGVFGDPVEHSLSPCMHQAAIAALELDYVYVPFHVRREDLADALRALPALGVRGVNLTIPHKERALALVDEVTPEAEASGAVNTVRVEGTLLVGHCTDGAGFMAPLTSTGIALDGVRAVVVGAGGAARSVVHRLVSAGAAVLVANRRAQRAADLCAAMERYARRSAPRWVSLDDSAVVQAAMAEADLVVNTTPIGMWPHLNDAPPAPAEWLRQGCTAYDLIYRPEETLWLRRARERGCRTINGIGMLVHQGAESLAYWTGARPPADVMEGAVRIALTGP